MIDMNYFSQYHPEIGFRIGVEGIHQNKEKAFFAVLCSINPPASFYDPGRRTPPTDVSTQELILKLIPFTKLNWQSIVHTVKFDEDLYTVNKIAPGANLTLLFHIKQFKPNGQQFVDYGWAVMPLFDVLETDEDPNTLEFYVNSGLYQVTHN